MRISDWSSDVCSSDLQLQAVFERIDAGGDRAVIDERLDEECVRVVAGAAECAIEHIDRQLRGREVAVGNGLFLEIRLIVVAERQLEQRPRTDESGFGGHRERIAIVAEFSLETREDRRPETALTRAFLA